MYMSELNELKQGRNILLALHKSLVDLERSSYESEKGKLTAGAFLNLLLEDVRFDWLRRFSMLIVEIDEMLDLNDGIDNAMITSSLSKLRDLAGADSIDDDFGAKFRAALEMSPEAAALNEKLKASLSI